MGNKPQSLRSILLSLYINIIPDFIISVRTDTGSVPTPLNSLNSS